MAELAVNNAQGTTGRVYAGSRIAAGTGKRALESLPFEGLYQQLLLLWSRLWGWWPILLCSSHRAQPYMPHFQRPKNQGYWKPCKMPGWMWHLTRQPVM